MNSNSKIVGLKMAVSSEHGPASQCLPPQAFRPVRSAPLGPRRGLARLAVGALLLALPVTAQAAQVPVPVSPGTPEGARVESRCPTFLWAAVPGARAYEVMVYRPDEEGGRESPLWSRRLPASAPGWTPPLEDCLEPDGSYAWSVRALGEGGTGDWSPPSHFQVATEPDGAGLETAARMVRRLRRQAGTAPPGTLAGGELAAAGGASVAGSGGVAATRSPEAAMAASGDAIQVDDAPVVLRSDLCGNGVVEPWEVCDDGAGVSGDCCGTECSDVVVTSGSDPEIGQGVSLSIASNSCGDTGSGATVGGKVHSPFGAADLFFRAGSTPTFPGALTTSVSWENGGSCDDPCQPVSSCPFCTPIFIEGAEEGIDNWMKVIRDADGAVSWAQFEFAFPGLECGAPTLILIPLYVTRVDGADFSLALAVAAAAQCAF